MKKQQVQWYSVFAAVSLLATGVGAANTVAPVQRVGAATPGKAEVTSTTAGLEVREPEQGRAAFARLKDRLKQQEGELKRLQEKSKDPENAPDEAQDKRVKKLKTSISETKKKLSKEKQRWRKDRAHEQRTLKRRWGKALSLSGAKAELQRHAERMARLERVYFLGVVNKDAALAGHATVLIAAEQQRHEVARELIQKGRLPAYLQDAKPAATDAPSDADKTNDADKTQPADTKGVSKEGDDK